MRTESLGLRARKSVSNCNLQRHKLARRPRKPMVLALAASKASSARGRHPQSKSAVRQALSNNLLDELVADRLDHLYNGHWPQDHDENQ